MISNFDEFAADLLQHSALSELSGTVIAIEAAHYLRTRVFEHPEWREPLLSAVGGLPFGMKRLLQADLDKFRAENITPYFIFPGLDVGQKDNIFRESEDAARVNNAAWELYDQHQAERAVATFGQSGYVKPADLFRALQTILREANGRFLVAPYSAAAELSYLERNMRDQIQAIYGEISEVLLYDVERVITNLDFERKHFTWFPRRQCMLDLNNISSDQFVDACLLAGCSSLPTLPQLENSVYRKQAKIKSAVEMMLSLGRTGYAVCRHYQDDPQFRNLNYLEEYCAKRAAVKHHIVITNDGKIEPFDADHVPSDLHDVIGQRLPDEMYYYLSKGVIAPKSLNWRTTGRIVELPPVDGGESEDYRQLVRQQLTPVRTMTLSLLSFSLNRYYQHKDIKLRCWFDPDTETTISMRDLTDPRPMVASWNVKESLFNEQASKLPGCGLLAFTVRSLRNTDFAQSSITRRDIKKPGELTSKAEILNNAIWRLLQLREYVDSKHRLTPWGEVLATMLDKLDGQKDLEEGVFIAVELARLGLLNSRNMFPTYIGGASRGTDTEKRNVILVSRVACLGKLHHKPLGFTGPLSRHLLGFHSMIEAVRNSLRDLAEVSSTTLLLNGDADRDKADPYLNNLGLELPFLLPNDCALGIAVKSYLEELLVRGEPESPETHESVRETAKSYWFPECIDLTADLKSAFQLWDAVYAGMASAGSLIKDESMWKEVNEWLSKRR